MNVKFQLVAYTDAAGKFTPEAYLNGNEDNFFIDDNLKDCVPYSAKPGEVISLSDEGMIMAVADGMGGMNAGEVASDIAVKTVEEFFTLASITAEQSSTYEKRREYLEDVIKECDRRIKADSKNNSEHNGMGSTIILAWIAHGEITISWLGDSRAYRYNPSYGIQALSKDHSYVQELVDKGVITYEQSFDHPQGNIVVRSLGDVSSEPHPESRNYTVAKNDLFLLCSDGLSGVLRDRKAIDPTTGTEYPEETLEEILYANYDDINKCRESLFEAAERGDWYDNVTAVLCKIVSVDEDAGPIATRQPSAQPANVPVAAPVEEANGNISKSIHLKVSGKGVLYIVMGIMVVIATVVSGIYFLMNSGKTENKGKTSPDTVIVKDTVILKPDAKPDARKVGDVDKKDKSVRPTKASVEDLKKAQRAKQLKTIPSSPTPNGLSVSTDPNDPLGQP